ncbi:uncharacterized protein LOC112052717 [Bicyclus anynana]|uniref:Uncharacterized protein LOC112052717 n=1 Tax=Bicyclus anynana TaxID=110368 RepID=A0A6J1NW83_BICAN|nr:uncharacterized protein LOC112052717 [Bicyclus anynana]
MYRAVVLLVGVVVLVKTDLDVRRCLETAVLNSGCCRFNITEEKAAMMWKCAEASYPEPHSCVFETCVGENSGFLLSNGTIDKTLLEATLAVDYENNTDILEIVKEKCLVDDMSVYGPPGMCDAKKIANCLRAFTVVNCPLWVDSDYCNKVRDEVEKCESVFP